MRLSLRAFMKTAAAEALCRTGGDRLWDAAGWDGVLVLGYHRVVPDYREAATRGNPPMLTSVSMLERQLDWVGRRFRFVSLDELGDRLESGAKGGRPLAAVTFDDGYRDAYEHAFPLLQRKGIPGAVFVVTDLVGTTRLLTHDRLYLLLVRTLAEPPAAQAHLARVLRRLGLRLPDLGGAAGGPPRAFAAACALLETLSPAGLEQLMQALAQAVGPVEEQFPELRAMDWEMLRTMHRGGFTIGSHTSSHALLTGESSGCVRQELETSRSRLERGLGAPVRHFAYPDGRFHGGVVDAVAAAGYRLAYTTCRHRDARRPLLTVPRRLLWENACQDGGGRFSPAVLGCLVHGVFDVVSGCRQQHEASASWRAEPLSA